MLVYQRVAVPSLQDDGYIRAWSSEKGVSKQLWQMNCHRRRDCRPWSSGEITPGDV